jgi:hypothetical protein
MMGEGDSWESGAIVLGVETVLGLERREQTVKDCRCCCFNKQS